MGKTRDGLTPKQLHFCRCVAAGNLSAAQCYRESHSVTAEGKSATHREAASRLLARTDIQATVQRLIAQRERASQASALSDKTRVLSRLREWMDGSDSTSNQLRAAELLGKSVGLFKDVVETTDSRSSEELLAELDAMLEQTEPDQPNDSDDSAEPSIMH